MQKQIKDNYMQVVHDFINTIFIHKDDDPEIYIRFDIPMPNGESSFGIGSTYKENDHYCYYYGAFPNTIFSNTWQCIGLGSDNKNGKVWANNVIYSKKRIKTIFYVEEYKTYYESSRIEEVDGLIYSNDCFRCITNGERTDIRTLDEFMDYLNRYLN
jgi:hypothetical protein